MPGRWQESGPWRHACPGAQACIRGMRCHQGVQGQEGRRDGGEAGKAEAAGQDARGRAHRLAGGRDRRAEGAGEGLKGAWRAGEGARRAPQAAGRPERLEATFRLGADDPASSASAACEAPGVSRRGHCGWMAAAPGRAAREKAGLGAEGQAGAAYGCRGFRKGSRQAVDRLRRKQGAAMSRREVQRIARRHGPAPRRRKKNPCRPIGADGLPRVAASAASRQFRRGQPPKAISADMACLPGRDGSSHLSGAIGCEAGIALAHVAPSSMEERLVPGACGQLKETGLPDGIRACSDQGVRCTARACRGKPGGLGTSQPMPRRACCWDNAPVGSLWGRMKEQIGDASQMPHEETVALADDHIGCCSSERGQARSGWLAPMEYAAKLVA